MSTQAIITENNLPTGDLIGRALADTATDLLKEKRFEIGRVCHHKKINLLRLARLHCNDFCYMDDDQDDKIREYLIRASITKINEL